MTSPRAGRPSPRGGPAGWVVGRDDAVERCEIAQGQVPVAAQLDQMSAAWTVLHAVALGGWSGTLDHLVIGPAGVFGLLLKHHASARIWATPRSLVVNGHHTRYLPQAVSLAQRAAARLSAAMTEPLAVRPVLVFVGAEATLRGECPAVTITDNHHLRRWLEGQSPRLDQRTVTALAAAGQMSATWQSTGMTRRANR